MTRSALRRTAEATEEFRYRYHLASIASVACGLTLVKVVSAVVVGSMSGATIQFTFWHGFVPLIRFGTDGPTFALIVGWSSVATSIAALGGFVLFGYRRRLVLRCLGWLGGLWSVFLLIVADAVMNGLGEQRIPNRLLILTTVICMAGLASAFVLLSRPGNRFIESLRYSFSIQQPMGERFA